MKRNPAWLALGLMLFVIVACSLGKKTTNVSTTTNESAGSDTSASDSTSTGAISDLHMAKDDKGDPGDETTVFSEKDRTVHSVAKLKEPKSGMKIKFSWWVVDAEGVKNQKLRDIDYTTRAFDNIVHGHLTAPRDWPPGKYKVEVYVNDNLEKTVNFTVE